MFLVCQQKMRVIPCTTQHLRARPHQYLCQYTSYYTYSTRSSLSNATRSSYKSKYTPLSSRETSCSTLSVTITYLTYRTANFENATESKNHALSSYHPFHHNFQFEDSHGKSKAYSNVHYWQTHFPKIHTNVRTNHLVVTSLIFLRCYRRNSHPAHQKTFTFVITSTLNRGLCDSTYTV